MISTLTLMKTIDQLHSIAAILCILLKLDYHQKMHHQCNIPVIMTEPLQVLSTFDNLSFQISKQVYAFSSLKTSQV